MNRYLGELKLIAEAKTFFLKASPKLRTGFILCWAMAAVPQP